MILFLLTFQQSTWHAGISIDQAADARDCAAVYSSKLSLLLKLASHETGVLLAADLQGWCSTHA